MRELDERLVFGELIAQHLTDSRRGKKTRFPLADLLRRSVYSRIADYEDVNDAERLWQDPTPRGGADRFREDLGAGTIRCGDSIICLVIILLDKGGWGA